jgi:hypothetical protein
MSSLLRQLRLAALSAPVVVGLSSTIAAAEPGEHLQLGASTELAPRLELGLQARSNLTQSPTNPVSGVSLLVAPGARLSHETPDTRVDLDGSYRLTKFFTRRLSGLDQLNDFDVNLDVAALRTRPVGLVLSNRAALVNNNATDRLGNTPFVTRTRNDLRAGLQIRPGPILQIDARGRYELDDIRVPEGALASDTRGLNTRNGFGGLWDVEYRFFPRTALALMGDLTRYDWVRNAVERGATGSVFALPDSTHFRLLFGLRGRVSNRLSVVGQLGYGSANYSVASVQSGCAGAGCTPGPGNAFDAKLAGLQRLLVLAQATYEISDERRVVVGYRKDFDDVFFTNYLAYHSLYAGVDANIGERFRVDGRGSLRAEAYRGAVVRSDTFVNLDGGATYLIQDWLKLRAGAGFMQRTVPAQPEISFNDVRGQLVLTVTY